MEGANSKANSPPFVFYIGNLPEPQSDDQGVREALSKSPLARRWLCGMGCAKGDDANETAEGGAVSSEGRCDPAAGCRRPDNSSRGLASPPLPDPRFVGPLGPRSEEPSCCAAGIVVPATTFVARLMIIPISTSNALSEDLFRTSLGVEGDILGHGADSGRVPWAWASRHPFTIVPPLGCITCPAI
jgi:hypothetical protein